MSSGRIVATSCNAGNAETCCHTIAKKSVKHYITKYKQKQEMFSNGITFSVVPAPESNFALSYSSTP